MKEYVIENRLGELVRDLTAKGYEVRKADSYDNCLEINKGVLFEEGKHTRLKNHANIQLKDNGIILQIKDTDDYSTRMDLFEIIRHYLLE